MPGTLSPSPWFTGLDDAGVTLPGAKLFTYASGTTTKLATYTNAALSSANTNPIILDAAGRAVIYLQSAAYKYVLAPANDTDPPVSPIKTIDPVNPVPPTAVDLDVLGTSGPAITAGQVVFLSNGLMGGTTAGIWYLATASEGLESISAVVIGIALTSSTGAGEVISIRLAGRVTNQAGLTIGSTYYIATGAGGSITATKPETARIIGYADTSTSLIMGEKVQLYAEKIATVLASTGNVGAGEDTLYSRTGLTDEISSNGMGWHGYFWGLSANNANGKILRVRCIEGANDTIVGSLTLTANEAGRWVAEFHIQRMTSTTWHSSCRISVGPNAAAVSISSNTMVGNPGATATFANVVEIRITGQAVADNDIVLEGGILARIY